MIVVLGLQNKFHISEVGKKISFYLASLPLVHPSVTNYIWFRRILIHLTFVFYSSIYIIEIFVENKNTIFMMNR